MRAHKDRDTAQGFRVSEDKEKDGVMEPAQAWVGRSEVSGWTFVDLRGSNKHLVCQQCDKRGQEMFVKYVTVQANGNSSALVVSVRDGGCLPHNGDDVGAPLGNRNWKGFPEIGGNRKNATK